MHADIYLRLEESFSTESEIYVSMVQTIANEARRHFRFKWHAMASPSNHSEANTHIILFSIIHSRINESCQPSCDCTEHSWISSRRSSIEIQNAYLIHDYPKNPPLTQCDLKLTMIAFGVITCDWFAVSWEAVRDPNPKCTPGSPICVLAITYECVLHTCWSASQPPSQRFQ